jgi:outer membrane lipoprotein
MNMNILKNIAVVIFLLFFSLSCSVISREVRNDAMAPMPFKTLVQNAGEYAGQTVILGGYIIGTENRAEETLISVLQTPLSTMDYPYYKDKTEGRFVARHKGFLDPEVYRRDRRITVAGTIAGLQTEQIGSCPYECLTIDSREIYLWSEDRDYYVYDDPFVWSDDPFYQPFNRRFYYPYSRHSHPYNRRFYSPYGGYPYYPYW